MFSWISINIGIIVFRWIGLSDQSSFNTFEWSDGNPVLYTRWAQNNPVNVGNEPGKKIASLL